MGFKKKSKVSAEFSMSSLTDIIFLLLIFFMLTSSLIIPNALNLKLPGKANSSPPSKSQPAIVTIERNGTYFYNGEKVSLSGIDSRVRTLKKGNKKASIVITPDPNAANEKVVAVLDMAFRYGLNAILTDPK
jgi:biopolymer transport protein ExbD